MASCSCWVLYRWWLDRPLMYRCLLGMADIKPQLRRVPTQLTQRGSCTEVFKYYTTKAPELYTKTYAAPSHTPWSITLPRVTTPPRRRSTTWFYVCCPFYYTEVLSITLLSLLTACIFLSTILFFSCYTEVPAFSTKTAEYYTEVAKYFSTPIYTTQSRLATQKLFFRALLNWNTTLMLQSTTPRPTLHLATTPQPSVHQRSRLLHNHVRCLVYYTEEFKYYPAPNYYHLMFICFRPAILLTLSSLLMLLLPIHRSSVVYLWMCWNIAEIQDWSINYVYVSIFSWSTFPLADNFVMWENISDCHGNFRTIDLAKYNKNSKLNLHFNNILLNSPLHF